MSDLTSPIPTPVNRLLTTPVPGALAAPAAQAVASVPAATMDSVSLSGPAVSTVAPQGPASVREELQNLQADLAKLSQRVEALIARVDAMPAAASTAPALPAPPVPAEPQVAAVGGTHDVKAGDFLWKIAADKLGDAGRWPEIYALNKDVIGDNPNLILPGQKLRLPQVTGKPPAAVPPAPPLPPVVVQPPAGVPGPTPQVPAPPIVARLDVPVVASSNRQLPDAEAQRLAVEFGLSPANAPLTPAVKANVLQFLDEMAAYEGSARGKVFGPGMEALGANPQEVEQIRASVKQIQQALDLLIKAGRLRVADAQGRTVTGVNASGSFFLLDAQGKERRDAAGNPVMDEAFIAAVTQFKQAQGIRQSYKLADGTYAINEYVGPATVEALKKALVELQQKP